MKTESYNELLSLSKVQSYSGEEWRMFAYLVRWFKKHDIPFYKDRLGNLYATKGEAEHYPCIVAHTDTVFEIEEDLTVIEVDGCLTGFNKYTMKQRGTGFDDKVGIWVALESLKAFNNLKVAFFIDEETGCNGSYEADMDFFEDCSYVLQCDRQGSTDFVTKACGVNLSSEVFQMGVLEALSNHGYNYCETGGMTDVMALKENGLKVSCANIACGYYNPHMEDEFIVVEEVEGTLDMVTEIISSLGEEVFLHNYEGRSFNKGYVGRAYYGWDEDEEYLQDRYGTAYLPIQDDLCQDCWQNKADKSGLCKECQEWYKPVKRLH